MAVSTVTMLPDGTVTTSGITVTGAANAQTALSDASDASYITSPSIGAITLSFANPTIPVGSTIISVQVIYRSLVSTNQNMTVTVSSTRTSTFAQKKTGAITTNNGPVLASIGGALSITDINNLKVQIAEANPSRTHEISVVVTYNAPPTVTGTTPSGVIGLAQPTWSFTYADPEGDLQVLTQSRIYTAATVALGGFTPDDTTHYKPFLDEIGVTPLPTYTPSTPLPPGSYRLYVRASDAYNAFRFSAWDFVDFTIQLAVPATPKILAGAYDTLRGRTPLTIFGFDNLLSDNQAGAETNTTDFVLTNCTAALDTTATKIWSRPDGPLTSLKSLRLTASSAANISADTVVDCKPGQMIVAGGHVFSTTPRLATAAIKWVDSGGSSLGTTTGAQQPTAVGTAPAPIFVVDTAPAGTAHAHVIVTVIGCANAEQHWIDDFFLSPTVADQMGPCSTWNGNMVSNTSFETYAGSSGNADWGLVQAGGQTVTAIALVPSDGAQSMLISTDGVNTPPYAEWPSLAASVPRLPVVAGDVIVVTGYQYNNGASAGITVEAVYQDGTHHEITLPTAFGGDKEPFVAGFQIPAGKTGVTIRFLPAGVTAGAAGAILFDAVNIVRATTQAVTEFHAQGGASGVPKGASYGSGSMLPFKFATSYQPFYPWIRGGLRDNASFLVQRSIDGGANWTTVRGLNNGTITPDIVGVASVYDYEMQPGTVTQYAATEMSKDPLSLAVVSSPASAPLISDPSFEQLQWNGIDLADTYANQFQPIFGAKVGAITRQSSGAAGSFISTFSTLPLWASFIRVRFLCRRINANALAFNFLWFDLVSGHSFLGDTTALTVPASAGDSGWAWYDTGQVAIPPFASTMLIAPNGPAPVDPAQPMLLAFDGVQVIPGDAGAEPIVTMPDCLMWLKDPLNPGANLQLTVEGGDVLSSTSTESQFVMQPAGRADPVVIADVIQAEAFDSVSFIFANDAQWLAFEALRKAQRTLLLQLPSGDLLGEQHYVRLGDVRTDDRIITQDQNRTQRRRVTVAAREVAAP